MKKIKKINFRFEKKKVTITRVTFILQLDKEELIVDGNEDFEDLIEELCNCDGFFAIRGISDRPLVRRMIELGLVKHSQNRGCYASELLRKNRNKILEEWNKVINLI